MVQSCSYHFAFSLHLMNFCYASPSDFALVTSSHRRSTASSGLESGYPYKPWPNAAILEPFGSSTPVRCKIATFSRAQPGPGPRGSHGTVRSVIRVVNGPIGKWRAGRAFTTDTDRMPDLLRESSVKIGTIQRRLAWPLPVRKDHPMPRRKNH